MTTKKFKLASHEIKPIVGAMGGCIATDRITVEGYPVRFMCREEPDNQYDSGWRFLSGFEDDAYMADPAFHEICQAGARVAMRQHAGTRYLSGVPPALR
ncbi:MAG: DUF2185 domain-containing protein [Burkholderiales bacterium]